jgi:hypothetical protein
MDTTHAILAVVFAVAAALAGYLLIGSLIQSIATATTWWLSRPCSPAPASPASPSAW